MGKDIILSVIMLHFYLHIHLRQHGSLIQISVFSKSKICQSSHICFVDFISQSFVMRYSEKSISSSSFFIFFLIFGRMVVHYCTSVIIVAVVVYVSWVTTFKWLWNPGRCSAFLLVFLHEGTRHQWSSFHNSLVVISCQSSSNLQICSLSFIRYLSSGCMWINISEWLYVVWYWRFSRIGTSQGQLFSFHRRFSPHDGSSQGVPWDPFSYRSNWLECIQWVQPFDSRSV